MLLLVGTTDKIELVTAVAADIDVHASYIDITKTTGAFIDSNKQATAITTATTTDIVSAAGAATTTRNVKTLNIRNKHATLANTVTVQIDISGTNYELFKTTLLAGETLEYIEGVGWFVVESKALNRLLRVSGADYVNATTSFTDITGLTAPVQNGKSYSFIAALTHINNASTTGSRFGINGPTLSNVHISGIDTVTNSATASVHSAGGATAVDTAFSVQTTGSAAARLAIMQGGFTAGADGTFAIRGQSEVAVAAGLTVRIGSFCHLFEATG
jgi:hypothetical protein